MEKLAYTECTHVERISNMYQKKETKRVET